MYGRIYFSRRSDKEIQSSKEKCLNINWSVSIYAPPPCPISWCIFFHDDLNLQSIESIHPKSICTEFIRPVGYFWLACISNVSLCNVESVGQDGRPAMDQPFSTNHLSYTETLVPIYRFRAITYFFYRKYSIFDKKWVFNIKMFLVMDLIFTTKHFP